MTSWMLACFTLDPHMHRWPGCISKRLVTLLATAKWNIWCSMRICSKSDFHRYYKSTEVKKSLCSVVRLDWLDWQFTCTWSGIPQGRFEPASPREMFWRKLAHRVSPVPASLHLLALQLKPSIRSSHPPFGFTPGDATATQGIGVWSTEVYWLHRHLLVHFVGQKVLNLLPSTDKPTLWHPKLKITELKLLYQISSSCPDEHNPLVKGIAGLPSLLVISNTFIYQCALPAVISY